MSLTLGYGQKSTWRDASARRQSGLRMSRALRMLRLFLEVGVAVEAHGALVRLQFAFAQRVVRPGGRLEMAVAIGAAHEQRGLPDRTGRTGAGRDVVQPQADAAVRRGIRPGAVR